MKPRAAVLVASDRISQGVEEDKSGALAAQLLADLADVVEVRVLPDDRALLADAMRRWCDRGLDLVLTVGGTGLGPRDVTPEATLDVIERETPGISTALLVQGLRSTPRAMLSRATSGVRGRTLIVNLPGSSSAVREGLGCLLEVLPHALEVIAGTPEPYRRAADP